MSSPVVNPLNIHADALQSVPIADVAVHSQSIQAQLPGLSQAPISHSIAAHGSNPYPIQGMCMYTYCKCKHY